MNSSPDPAPAAATSARVWTSLDLINWTKAHFEKKGIESPRLEAELLLAAALGCPRIRLYVDFEKPVAPDKLATFREFVKRRVETREPIQYLIGHTDFLDLRIKTTRAALIPRPETELLALWAVSKSKAIDGDAVRIADLCTGTGCVALYIAAKDPRAAVLASDISTEALALAAENAAALKLEPRVTFHAGDLFAALPEDKKGTLDVLVSNPPYVDPADKATLSPDVRDHEPPVALYANDRGLEVIGRIIRGAPEWLKPGGWLGIEFGAGQAEGVRALAVEAKLDGIEISLDVNKKPRYLFARSAQCIAVC